MMAKMKMGPKGQVVIPKMFRDNLGLKPGASVVIDCDENKLVITKAASNFVELAESIAKSHPKVKLTMEDIRKGYFQQLDERHARICRQ